MALTKDETAVLFHTIDRAFGLANRHHFGDIADIDKWAGMAQDTFMSLWDYDGHVTEYVKKNKT